MRRTSLSWLDLHWPRETTVEQQLGALALLATLGGSPILLSAVGSPGLVSHSLAIPEGHAEHVSRQLSAVTPGLRVDARASATPLTLNRAIEIRLSTRHRPLVAPDAAIVNRAILTALANVHGNERISLLWTLGTPLRPFAVPNHLTGLPSDSWLKELARAPFAARRPVDTDARNALREKQALPGWKVAGFVGVHAAGRTRQRQLIGQVLAALRTTEAPGVAFWVRSINPQRVSEARVPWRYPLRFNVGELASLSSWPVGETSNLPVLAQRTRLVAGRPELSQKGRILGVTTFPGSERPLAITASDSLRHTHVLGRSGVGKSTLLSHLIEHDMNAGRAVVVIEPKDLINEVLARVPDHRVNDVVLLSPKDLVSVVGLNPLANASQHPEIVADQILAVFKSLYGSMLGPRTTDILSASLHTLARVPGASLAGLPLILSDAGYRRRCLAYVNDPIALEPFWAAFEAWSDAARTEAIAPLLNKVRPLLLRPQLRAVLGQAHPRFDLREVFTKRRILLVNTSKGELGFETAALLGSLVVSMLWSATLERTAIAPERRHQVSVVLDEFQDYLRLGTDLGEALAQARGLGVSFTLSHQFLHQMDPEMRSAVLANAQNRICFNLAEEDARVMASPGSGLEPEDFANLGAYEFYARLVARNAIMPWCSGRSLPPSPLVRNAEDVKAVSRRNYGRSRTEVDAEILGLTGRSPQESHHDIAPLPRPRSTS
jgi:hypothetical protein